MEVKTNVAFRPVRCLEEDLEKLAPVEGYVLFTTDTKKIYACIDGEYKMMGGSSGVYYANKYLTDEEKYGDQIIFSFLHTDIDGNALPAVDDLILNIPDGGFYRTLEVTDFDIQAQRIAISGGGSGGGGTGGGPSNEGSLIINYVTPKESATITGVDYYIEFEIVAKDSAGDLVSEEGNATWIINGKNYYQKVYNGKNTFKVDEYLDPSLDKNKLVLMVTMNTGGVNDTTVSKTWNVKAVDLQLEWNWNYTNANYISEDTFTLKFIPYGGIDCTAHIVFDDTYIPDETYFTKTIASRETGREVYSNTLPSLEYGTHTCEMYLTAEVNGETYQTPSIFNEITFIKDGSSTILTVPYYQTTATQYDTLNIPFLVYDPDQESCEVQFLVNDIEVGGDSYNRDLHYWPYTLTEYGSVKLTIKSKNNEAQKDLELVINKLDLEVDEVSGAAFSLKANTFSSNNEIRNFNYNGVTLGFSENFDWENGGLKTETLDDGSIQKYICVRQGTRMTVNYNLFEKFTSGEAGGKNFKLCFKATNCYDYSAPILECYEEQTKLGIKVDAQKTLFSTSTFPGFETKYYENQYIELETEIWPNVPDIDPNKNLYADRFLMFWIDGVPAGVKAYPTSEKFTHLTPKPIVIGSDLCDVYVYVMKIYERRLTENEHLDNFIMDAPSTNEMLSRYHRNNIVDNTGEISYEKLVQNNPDCHAYVYEVPKMTTSKDNKVKNCNYFELYGDHNTINNPYYKAINEGNGGVQIRVQGTSSAAYGVAAFNMRTEFQEGLIDKDGNKVDGWEINETAIPIDYVCTKVNVASSENANNVVNQEWYNKFQPYHDAHRRKTREDGRIYRDTMQFNSGVVFIKDNNTETNYYNDEGKPDRAGYLNANMFLDTPGYTSKPYYKMYSIGNMGNDKKNADVFHDTSNPKACCVEVADNQNAEHWMTVPINMSQFDLEKPFHEFRWPDGNGEASTEQKQAWVDFVNWMAASNPNGGDATKELKANSISLTADTYKPNIYFVLNSDGYYEKAEGVFDSATTYYEISTSGDGPTASVVFAPYTFKGFDPPGYEGKENPTGISLKGSTVSAYSSTKVTETPKLDDDGEWMYDEDGNVIMEKTYSVVPYTHDTKEYRMAKMLSECEDHLVMDSVVFHYLFIQRHTMVDNVAKNTFWSSEDLIHWDLTKDYDNDTSDGNDNSGYLTFDYGLEILDKTAAGGEIFNAAPSVWLNFIHGLGEAQKTLHKLLEGKGAWEANAYLEEFNKHQSPIPERCWIYDYFRKYIRPRRLGLDENTYLNRLEGGKKTHQRRQYETYQEFYINSKYIAGTAFTDGASIDMRLNSDPQTGIWNTNNTLPASFYIDCYASCHFGGQIRQSGRLKRGDIYGFPVGQMVSNPSDSTAYIYGANMIQTLTGLSEVYPTYANLSSATKLREISYGSDAPGYKNEKLSSIDIGSNAMLQNAYAQNVGKPDGIGSLDLSKAAQLRELKLNGSTLKALKLATGSTVELLYLNSLSTLTMENLNRLTDIQLDDGIYSSLTDITVKNCPAFDSFSYELALTAPINYYVFNDFTWTINVNTTKHFEYEAGNVVGIKVLDKLLQARPQQDYTNATALVGKIVIDTNCNVDEYAIYQKYIGKDKFPNVIIEYTSNVTGIDPAVELKFMASEDPNAAVFYRVLGSGEADGASIGTLISENGPTGIAITDPSKSDTSEFTYTFTGYWKDAANNRYYKNGLENPDASATNFNDIIPTASMVFYPIFLEATKEHEVKFYDYDGNIILQDGQESFGVPYGSTYAAAGGPMTNYYYLDSSKLPSNQRYGFKGWSTAKFKVDEGKNIEFVDLNTFVIKKAINLYPYYVTEDVETVATNPDYFMVSGSQIVLKEEYKDFIAGKITIPEMVGATTVGSMRSAPGITHVFFLRNSTVYDTIGANAFNECSNLIEVNLPDSIRYIKNYAFRGCTKMTTINLNDNIVEIGASAFAGLPLESMIVEINELPTSLTQIGGSAFQNAGPNIKVTRIPNGVTELQSYTFSRCQNVKISEFGSDGSGSQLTSIGTQCFAQSATGNIGSDVTSITFHPSITTLGSQAFQLYGKAGTLLEVTFLGKTQSEAETLASMAGFSGVTIVGR